jgi:ubiquinone/menaquinone biosynthesis C-methylase UbiE
MDPSLRQNMLVYYNERAPEYEEAYKLGTGTASITDPTVFIREIAALAGVVGGFGNGHVIDLACGTGFWLPHYILNCSRVTLFDQSEKMLAECERKVTALGVADRCALICGDVFHYDFQPAAYDCALIGFLLSHVSESDEALLFETLRRILRPPGRFLILDSAWTELRAKFNGKEERQERRLNDGTTFEIYKRYLDRRDVARWEETYHLAARVEHFGAALCAVSGNFRADSAHTQPRWVSVVS